MKIVFSRYDITRIDQPDYRGARSSGDVGQRGEYGGSGCEVQNVPCGYEEVKGFVRRYRDADIARKQELDSDSLRVSGDG